MGHHKLELTIISANSLKDVRHFGNMQTYCVIWVDNNHKLSTNIDLVGGENPVWKDKFELLIPEEDFKKGKATLHIEIYTKSLPHSKLVGTAYVPLEEIYKIGMSNLDQPHYRAYDIKRPSGRVQGKIHISFCLEDPKPPETSPPPRMPSPTIFSRLSQTSPSSILTKQVVLNDKAETSSASRASRASSPTIYPSLSQTSPSSILTKQVVLNDKAGATTAPPNVTTQSSQFTPSSILKSHANVKLPSIIRKHVSFAPLPTKRVSSSPGDPPAKEDLSSSAKEALSSPTSISSMEAPRNALSDIKEAASKFFTNFDFMKKQIVDDSKQKYADQAIEDKGVVMNDRKFQGTVFAMPTPQPSLQHENVVSPLQETATRKSLIPPPEPEKEATSHLTFNKDVKEHGLDQNSNKYTSVVTPPSTNIYKNDLKVFHNQRQAPPHPKHELGMRTFHMTRASSKPYGPLFHGNLGGMLLA